MLMLKSTHHRIVDALHRDIHDLNQRLAAEERRADRLSDILDDLRGPPAQMAPAKPAVTRVKRKPSVVDADRRDNADDSSLLPLAVAVAAIATSDTPYTSEPSHSEPSHSEPSTDYSGGGGGDFGGGGGGGDF